MQALYWLAAVVQLVCWVIVLIKMFQRGQIVLGIVGIICGIVAFIYGWVKAGEWRLQKVMGVWTAALLLQLVVGFSVGFPGTRVGIH